MNTERIELYQSMVKNDLQLIQISLKMERNYSEFLTSQTILLKDEKRKPYRNMFCINHYKKNIKDYKKNINEQKIHTETYRGYLERSELKLKDAIETLTL